MLNNEWNWKNFIPTESKLHVISFPFLISDLGSKFTSTFFKCYCVGYMKVANSFSIQVLCGVNTFFCPCGVIFLGSIFFRYYKKVTCNYGNYSKIGFCVIQKFQIRLLVIFSDFKVNKSPDLSCFCFKRGI